MCRSDINNVREDILLKGYASVTDVMKFIPCGYDKAKKIIDEITKMVEEKGKRVFLADIQYNNDGCGGLLFQVP